MAIFLQKVARLTVKEEFEYLPEGNVCTPRGFLAGGHTSGIKASGMPDTGVLFSEVQARCFAVFTRNKVQAAPVLLGREVLASHSFIRAVTVNSGNANACTGAQGMKDAREMAELTRLALGLNEAEVLVSSTGIIGQPLPMDKLRTGIPQVCSNLSAQGGHHFAEAILTTDTVTKHGGAVVPTAKGEVCIGGCTKGSGMIHPNMATMLAYVTTDLELPEDFYAEYRQMIHDSFNSITVDGDTSTNDTCLLLANGQSGMSWEQLSISEQGCFRRALFAVLESLAKKIVLDGEGATKIVEIRVEEAESREEARHLSRFVANSSLVKTAIFGEDPNWGRLLSSAGASGVDLDPEKVDIHIGDHLVVRAGCGTGIDKEILRKVVCQKEYTIRYTLGRGTASGSAWTSDLSYEYVRINAEYTT